MNKEELVHAIAKQSGLSKKSTEDALNAFIAVVQATVKDNQKVALVGFGTFELRERAARKCINPRTKEEMTVPARKVAVFKAGKGFQLEQAPASTTGKKKATSKQSATAKSEAAATTTTTKAKKKK